MMPIIIIVALSVINIITLWRWQEAIKRFEKHERDFHPNHFMDDIEGLDEKLDYLLKSNAAIQLTDRFALEDYVKLKPAIKALFTEQPDTGKGEA